MGDTALLRHYLHEYTQKIAEIQAELQRPYTKIVVDALQAYLVNYQNAHESVVQQLEQLENQP
jgi:hypothetical protein